MRFCILLLSMNLYLLALSITETNIYERSNRVDIMLSFDGPFDGIISQKKETDFLAIELKNVDIKTNIEKDLSTIGISKIKIFKDGSDSYVFLQKNGDIAITASKNGAGYGLRLRATPIENVAQESQTPTKAPQANIIKDETKNVANEPNTLDSLLQKNSVPYDSYLSVLAILIVLILILLFVKAKVNRQSPKSKNSSWLFPNSGLDIDGIKVVSQEQIDVKNRAVLFEADGIRYFVIIGVNGISVLDKRPKEYKGGNLFDTYLNENTEKLEHYMGETNRLENYKKKASGNY